MQSEYSSITREDFTQARLNKSPEKVMKNKQIKCK